MKKITFLAFQFLLLLSVMQAICQPFPPTCGKWRWDVKTLTDKGGVSLLSKVPVPATIEKIVKELPPKVLSSRNTYDGKLPRYASEQQVVEVIAFVTEIKYEKDDNDLHFVLKSPVSELTMVGEIPFQECPAFKNYPQLRKLFKQNRLTGEEIKTKLKNTGKPVKVKVTGVLFWDGVHAQNPVGASKYCREIHPITHITLL